MSSNQRGLTLLELQVSLVIVAIITPLIGGIIFMLQFYPTRSESDLEAQQDMQLAAQWLAIDANAASDFTTSSLAQNEYGKFTWSEFGGSAEVAVVVTYLYDSSTTSLVREVTRDGVLDGRRDLARNVSSSDDVSITFTSPAYEQLATSNFRFVPGEVTLTITSTVEKLAADEALLNETASATMRLQFERTVLEPGGIPLPPGRIAYENWETGDISGVTG